MHYSAKKTNVNNNFTAFYYYNYFNCNYITKPYAFKNSGSHYGIKGGANFNDHLLSMTNVRYFYVVCGGNNNFIFLYSVTST